MKKRIAKKIAVRWSYSGGCGRLVGREKLAVLQYAKTLPVDKLRVA